MMDIFAFGKTVKKIKFNDLKNNKNNLIWIDVTDITKDEAELLRIAFELHPLTSEDLFNSHIRIKVEEFSNYLFCAFYGVKKEKKIEFIELDFAIGKNFLITNHRRELKSFSDLKNDTKKLENLFGRGLDFIFHKLLDMEVDNYFPILEELDNHIEKLEEKVAKKPTSELLTQILSVKRLVIKFKKTTFPQREKVSFLAKGNYHYISKKAVLYFRDIYDHSIRVSDTVDNYREAIGNAFDVYMSAMSNNMNEVMKTLSIIATIALPLSVISGIYGTNFTVLPGSHAAYGFWIMILGMAALCVFMLFFFRKRGWF